MPEGLTDFVRAGLPRSSGSGTGVARTNVRVCLCGSVANINSIFSVCVRGKLDYDE